MSKKTKKTPSKAEPPAAQILDTPEAGKSGGARPPESAENFEHVLRRLIVERDHLSHDG